MPDWIAPVFGLLGVILGAGISEFRHWRESKEQYRIMTFERRLQKHQEALSLCYELENVINVGKTNVEKYSMIDKFNKWWDNNCLLLDETSRKEIMTLLKNAQEHVSGETINHYKIYHQIRKTQDTIVRGIGAKYLPEMPKRKQEL